MRRVCVVVVLVALGSTLAVGAQAQGKDPFRPPPVAGRDATEGLGRGEPPAVVSPGEPEAPGDGLARTGQDVSAQLALGLLVVALGCALRMAERGADLGRPRRLSGPAGQ